MASKNLGNDYVISVVLKQQDNALKTLTGQIDALKAAAKTPIKLSVALDTKALANLEQQVVGAIGRGTGLTDEVARDVAAGMKKGKTQANREPVPIKIDMNSMTTQFMSIARVFADTLERRLNQVLDFGKLSRRMQKQMEATRAGLGAAFEDNRAGVTRAVNVETDPHSTRAQRRLAQIHLNRFEDHLVRQAELRHGIKARLKDRLKEEELLATLTRRERTAYQRELSRNSPSKGVQTRQSMREYVEPHTLVGGRSVSISKAREIQQILGQVETQLGNAPAQIGSKRGMKSKWNRQQFERMFEPMSGDQVGQQIIADLGGLARLTREAALKGVANWKREISKSLRISTAMQGPSVPHVPTRMPTMSRAQILRDLHPDDLAAVLSGKSAPSLVEKKRAARQTRQDRVEAPPTPKELRQYRKANSGMVERLDVIRIEAAELGTQIERVTEDLNTKKIRRGVTLPAAKARVEEAKRNLQKLEASGKFTAKDAQLANFLPEVLAGGGPKDKFGRSSAVLPKGVESGEVWAAVNRRRPLDAAKAQLADAEAFLTYKEEMLQRGRVRKPSAKRAKVTALPLEVKILRDREAALQHEADHITRQLAEVGRPGGQKSYPEATSYTDAGRVQRVKAAEQWVAVQNLERMGGKFHRYRPQERQLLHEGMLQAERQGHTLKLEKMSKLYGAGGEWHVGEYQGSQIQRAMGPQRARGRAEAPLEEAISVLAGAPSKKAVKEAAKKAAAETARGSMSMVDVTKNFQDFSKINFGKIAGEFSSFVTAFETSINRFAAYMKTYGSARSGEWARVATAVEGTKGKQIAAQSKESASTARLMLAEMDQIESKKDRMLVRDKERKRADTQLAVKQLDATTKLAAAEAKVQQERLKNERMGLRNLAGASRTTGRNSGLTDYVNTLGLGPGLGMTEVQIKAALRANIGRTSNTQTSLSELQASLVLATARGDRTDGISKRLEKGGDKLDFLGDDFLNIMAAAGTKMPGTYGKMFDIQGPITQYQQAHTERLKIARLQAYAKEYGGPEEGPSIYKGGGPAGAPGMTLGGAYGPELPPHMQRALRARADLSKLYPSGADAKSAELQQTQHGIVNTLKEQVSQHLELEQSLKRQGTGWDFIREKLKSIMAYMGIGFVLYRIGAGIAQTTREVIELEHVMAELQGLMRGQSLSDMLTIKDSVLETARKYGLEIKGVAQVAKSFVQLGLSKEDVAKETEAAALGGAALNLTPEQTAQIMIGAREITGGKMTGLDVIDRIATVMRVSERTPVGEGGRKVNAEDLTTVIERVGSLAQMIQPQIGNVTAFDLLLGMQSTMLTRQQGVSGASTTTAIGGLFANLMRNSSQRVLQDQYGLKLGNESGGLRPVSDILQDAAKELKRLNAAGETTKAGALLQALAGAGGGGSAARAQKLAPLFEHMDEVLQTAIESSEAHGQAEKRAALEVDTLQNSLRGLRNSFTVFMDSLLRNSDIIGGPQGPLKAMSNVMAGAAKHPRTSLLGTSGALALGSFAAAKGATSLAGGMQVVQGLTAPASVGASGAAGAARLFTTLFMGTGIITVVIGAVLAALTAYNWWKRNAQPTEIQLEKEKFGQLATQYNMEPSKLAHLSLEAGRLAQVQTGAALGKSRLFEMTNFETDPSARRVFSTIFLGLMEQAVPDLSKIVDPAERLDAALHLVRESMEELERTSGFVAKKQELLTRMSERAKELDTQQILVFPNKAKVEYLRAQQAIDQAALTSLISEEKKSGPKSVEKMDNALIRAGNAQSRMTAVPGLGGAWKDRMLEALINYGSSRAQSEKMRELSGTIGYDYQSARRTNTRSFVENIERAIAETGGDLFRAKERVLGAQMDASDNVDLPAFFDTEANGGRLNNLKMGDLTAAVGTEASQSAQRKLNDAQSVVDALNNDKTLLGRLPKEMLEDLAGLVGGKDADQGVIQQLMNRMKLVSGIRTIAKEDAAAAEKDYQLLQAKINLIERERDMQLAILEARQGSARLSRDTGISRAELGPAGAAYGLRYADVFARGSEDAERIRAAGTYERLLIKEQQISDEEKNRLRVHSQINEDRNVYQAEERTSLEASRFLVDQQISLERDKQSSARSLAGGGLSGIRNTLGMPWKDAFAGSRTDVVERLFRPMFSGIQQRLADNFVDTFFGPNGVFALDKVFSMDLIMDRELVVREEYLRSLTMTLQAETAAKAAGLPAGSLPGVSVTSSGALHGVSAAVIEPKFGALPGVGLTPSVGIRAAAAIGAGASLVGGRVLSSGKNAMGIPNYVDPSMLTPEQKHYLRREGATDLSRVWINNGEWMYDLEKKTGKKSVPTQRVGAPSNRLPGESYDSYYERIRREQSGLPELPAKRSLGSLDPDSHIAMSQMLQGAKAAGLDVTLVEAQRSQERQERIWAKRPGATWTLSSDHLPGNAIDVLAGRGTPDEYTKLRQYILDNHPDLKLIGPADLRELPPDAFKDWGHVSYKGDNRRTKSNDNMRLLAGLSKEIPRVGLTPSLSGYAPSSGVSAGGGGAPPIVGFLNNPEFQQMLREYAAGTTEAGAPGGSRWQRFKGWVGKDRTSEQNDRLKTQASQMLQAQSGMFIGGAVNSKKGLMGMRFGAHGGNNYASEGGAIGSMIGSMLPIPGGTFIGALVGSLLGGIAGKGRNKQTPETAALEAIQRHTRETVTAIQNQTQMMSLSNRLIGVPASFRYPGYSLVAGGGQSAQQTNYYEINVEGSSDANMTAQAVVRAIKSDRRTTGNFSSRRR